MKLELLAKKAKRAHDGRAGRVDQRTVPLTAIEIEDLVELIEKCSLALPLPDTLEHR